jgi:hypothetical protein
MKSFWNWQRRLPMKLNQTIVINIVALMLLSCSSRVRTVSTSPISTPDIGIQINNKNLMIAAPQGWNTFKINQSISLMLRDISGQPIIINQDSGIKIFVFVVNKWVEVGNTMAYDSAEITLVPDTSFDPAKLGTTAVSPDLTDYPTSSNIRIFIIGNLANNEQFASYIDVTLNP